MLKRNLLKTAGLTIFILAAVTICWISVDIAISEQSYTVVIRGNNPSLAVPKPVFEVQPPANWVASNGGTLTPETLAATLCPGDCIDETKTATISEASAEGDIMFCFDLTGSMGGELAQAQANSINIMNAVNVSVPGTQFGVMSHMDYDGTHGGCPNYYSSTYGNAAWGDYPYSMDQAITGNTADVATAVNGLVLGDGFDWPENYTRPLYESYTDATIAWRTGTKKIVLAWLDAYPHDCDWDACVGGTDSSGPDPGPDEIDNNADDLEIIPVLNTMAANDITLIVLYSGTSAYELSVWECYTALTGGSAFQINTDGTIPGGIDIEDFIADIILAEVSQIDELTLEVCTPGYESWLTFVDPPSYTDVDLGTPFTGTFDITLCVPIGTAPGIHNFEICLIGDGVIYATQDVTITVPDCGDEDMDEYIDEDEDDE